jgi:phosphoribosylglycinamide formyltransferase 1
MRIGILVSGRGSNLAAILDAVVAGRLPGVEPALVISNRAGVPAVRIAERHGVPVTVLRRSAFPTAAARDAAIGRELTAAGVDLAVLAGYDRLLQAPYFGAFGGRTVNIHPSLLPRHGGRGMVGPAVHAAVLAAGESETGVTIHEVTGELDAGPILRQVRVPVRPGDGVEELAARVLAVEHETLVEMLADLAPRTTDVEASASMTRASAPRTLGGAEVR